MVKAEERIYLLQPPRRQGHESLLVVIERVYCPKAQGFCIWGLNKPNRNGKSQPLPFLTANFSTKPFLPLNQKWKTWRPWRLYHPKSLANNFVTLSNVGISWCFRCTQMRGEQSRRWPLLSHPLEAHVRHTRHPETDSCWDAIRCSPFIFMSLFSFEIKHCWDEAELNLTFMSHEGFSHRHLQRPLCCFVPWH